MPDLQDAGKSAGSKPIADLVVLAEKKPPVAEPGADEAGKLEAADRAMEAAKGGDSAGFVDAMEDFVRICVRKYK